MPGNSEISYLVDPEDLIQAVSEGWTAFARENRGESLVPPPILGQPLWHSIGDETTRSIYRDLLARVRRGEGPVQFRFRCDSPGTRRLLEMRIALGAGGGVTFTTTAVFLESRDPVALLDPSTTRNDRVLTSCAWCARVRVGDDDWRPVEEAISLLALFDHVVLPRLSHGMCPSCFDAMKREVRGEATAGQGVTTLGAL